MKNYLFILLAATLFSGACKKGNVDPTEQIDYLIFGISYGFCPSNCTHLYKLENEELFADDIDIGIPNPVPFLPTPLPDTKYQLAKDLLTTFPSDLLQSNQAVYGCPDCSDQGTVYIELKYSGTVRSWRLDPLDVGQTQAIIDYRKKIEDLKNLL